MKNKLLATAIAICATVSLAAFAGEGGGGGHDQGDDQGIPTNPGHSQPAPSGSAYGNYATEAQARAACITPGDRVMAVYTIFTDEIAYWTCAPAESEHGGGNR